MKLFARSLWPEGFRRPWLQLGFALVAAPVVLAGVVALAAFAVYWAGAPGNGAVEAAAQRTAWVASGLLAYLLGFSISLGLAGVALLWALGRRGVLAWLATGAGTGALYAAAVGAVAGRGIAGANLVVAAATGLALFALIRWFAGVRGG